MVAPALFSSATDEWATPQSLFDELNKEFRFELDVCASRENAKCECHFRREQDGLSQAWRRFATAAWMNPPYGRKIGEWVRKAYEESRLGVTVVCLLPARTDTKWWHDFVLPYGEVRFIKGRLRFGNAKHSAPFPSAIVVFRG